MKSILLAGALLLSAGSLSSGPSIRVEVVVKDDGYYTLLAQTIDDYYHSKDKKTSAEVIWNVVDEGRKSLPRFFPNSEFTLEDLLAFAMVESNFAERAIGKHQEVGIFQILKPVETMKAIGEKGDPFDPRINTRMALQILCNKHRAFRSKKKAIIAYNGIVKKADKTWDERYWIIFQAKREIIRGIVREVDNRKMTIAKGTIK